MAEPKRYIFSAEITVESDLEDFGEMRDSVLTMISNTAQILSKYGDTEVKKIDVVEIRQEGFSLEKSQSSTNQKQESLP